ncbi:MAG: hypothetical protein ABH950_01925 [Candidatus Altiarchaeota archaeon]
MGGVEKNRGNIPPVVMPEALSEQALKSLGSHQIHSVTIGSPAFQKVFEWIIAHDQGYDHPLDKGGNVFDTPSRIRSSLGMADENSRHDQGKNKGVQIHVALNQAKEIVGVHCLRHNSKEGYVASDGLYVDPLAANAAGISKDMLELAVETSRGLKAKLFTGVFRNEGAVPTLERAGLDVKPGREGWIYFKKGLTQQRMPPPPPP